MQRLIRERDARLFTNSLRELERSISLFVNFYLRQDLVIAISRKVCIGLSQFEALIFYSVCHFEVTSNMFK